MGRRGALLASIIGVSVAAAATPAAAAPPFHPRVGSRLGLIPVFTRSGYAARVDPATGAQTPVVYHGGSVMAGGITVHTIFWAPAGYSFEGSPGPGVPGYEPLVQQFFTDVAHDSGAAGACTAAECNAFTVLPQYAEGTAAGAITPGAYQINYSPAADSVDRADPYPAKADQCASHAGAATCVTDGQVTAEIDQVIQSTPGASRGLHNLWYVFLPPGVDECITAGACGTNAFAAYHSLSNPGGHGVTIYAVSVDPIVEGPIGPGADPQGFPDAEAAINGAAHETVEAMTDPAGTGWMDPNGNEAGDKCESGPQIGSPLGYASDGSPYNQVINGHQYLIQQMWANLGSDAPGCVQADTTASNPLPLPQVNLRQFSPVVDGNVNLASGGGIGVRVSLLRANTTGSPVAVAQASTTTAGDGSWSVSLAPHAVGDDRDEIDIDYSGASAPQPSHQVILTGNGGSPVAQAGWTGWSWLDAGTAASNRGGTSTLTLAPCSQTGVLSFSFNGATSLLSPLDYCNSQTDAATVTTSPIGPGDVLAMTSNDNRAFAPPASRSPNLNGGLVSLTVPVGEPGSVSAFQNPLAPGFTPTGLPSCTADLELGGVVCSGLVPNARYQLHDGGRRASGTADAGGLLVAALLVRPGDTVSLANRARTLTTLHVAHLRVGIAGEGASVAAGSCQAGDYYGAPLSSVPAGTSAGSPTNILTGGVALTGQVCPLSGKAAGLPTDMIAQTDDLSGGLTQTEVPEILDTSPINGETVYGTFRALAESGLTLPGNSPVPTDGSSRISLKIIAGGRGPVVFKAGNVDTDHGVAIPALAPGSYSAIWLLTDANGDERVVGTRFIALRGRTGPGPRASVSCRRSGAAVSCTVTFPANRSLRGQLRIRLQRGAAIVALGRGRVRRGRSRIRLATAGGSGSGPWRATLVLTRPHLLPVTIHAGVSGLG